MQPKLYERIMIGKRVTYREYIPPAPVAPAAPAAPDGVDDMTEGELVTMSVSVGVTCLMMMERMLKPHARNSRKLKQLEYAIFDMAKGTGAVVDPQMIDYWIGVWNSTMANIQHGLVNRQTASA